jgi:hypothetical protein
MSRPQKKLKTVAANKLKLVDASGKTRILLDAAGPQNTVFVNLFGASGEGLSLCLDNDQNPKIALTDQQGNTRITIGISNDLGPGLALYNAKNELVALVNVDAKSQRLNMLMPKNREKSGRNSTRQP